MTDPIVYGGFTQAELDAQYNNRARVPESVDIMAAYKARGDAYIAEATPITDLTFGGTPAEVLDVYPAQNASDPTPVMVYIHGGYWYSRHKDDFRFIPAGFAPAGATVVVVNYALIPDVDLGELVRQCEASVAWVYKNIAKYGGDPDRLYLTGHSAGGHVTAMLFTTDWDSYGVPASSIKGGVAISGLYDLEPIRLNYMGPELNFTEQTVSDFSPIDLKRTVDAPILFAVGGDESSEFQRHNGMLPKAWPGETDELVVPGLNHFTILEDFSTEGRTLNGAARKLMGLS